ncbi:MAG: hypothetical protein CL869_01825 [Cytophagia bacterium]|nr:hypothetical protein [Cytophagia bacterium]|tara:strand:- start:925 stop:1689 length:765 start_codon:yes stop_codon:yes gene_type:complete
MLSFKEKLKKSSPVIGTWVISPSPHSLNAICSSKLDFVILDQEHGAISNNDLLPLINTCKSNKVSCLVRPSSIDKYAIQHALDQGADGIQVPNIESKEDAQKVIEFSKYPPLGSRGYSPFVPSSDYQNNGSEWNYKMNNSLVTGINVEGKEAISNIGDILNLSNLDVVFVGLFDLSKAMGIPGDVHNIKVTNKLKEVINEGKKRNISIGTIATSLDHMEELINLGVNFVVYLVDMNVLKDSYLNIKNSFQDFIN